MIVREHLDAKGDMTFPAPKDRYTKDLERLSRPVVTVHEEAPAAQTIRGLCT